MIYTVTLNPALDISGTVKELIQDEKSYVQEEIQTPGGNGINAGIIARRLGGRVIATGFLGGPNGDVLNKLMDEAKLNHQFIPISGKTRMNLTVSNQKTHKQTRLSFPGPKVKKSELKLLGNYLLKIKSKDIVLFGGSLPPNVTPSELSRLISKIKAKGNKVFVDIPGKPLREVIKAKPDFIKPNLVEFQNLVGKKVETIKQILPIIRKLNESIPLVCVSSVEGGAILVSKDSAWYGRIPKVKIFSSVGAGDSMVGAISFRVSKFPRADVKELLQWGLAASCATLTEKGLTLGSKKSIRIYYPQIIMREL